MKKRRSNDVDGPDAVLGASQRQLRVGEELRHTLAGIFLRGDFRDPALLDLNVTVSEVRISPDLRNATAFVMPLGGGNVDDIVAGLNRAGPFIRGQIAKRVQLRLVPTLSFKADTSFEYAERIGKALRQPVVAADLEDEDKT